MVLAYSAVAICLAATIASVKAITCGPDNLCPSSTPCCGEYGQCGVGAYCLGGCDPRYSFDLNSCTAAPVCKSQQYDMTSLDDVMPNTKYLGDPSTANWVSSGTPLIFNNDSTPLTLLTMPADSVGTLMASTNYVWYGKVSATLRTSQGVGVVTAFILMSDVHDEIDFEFVGVELDIAQSNFYYQGITDYHNALNLSVSNTFMNTHTYEFDWSPTELNWIVDGNVMRTLKKSDTYNTTDNTYHYPQTPARIELSLWPAGLPTNGEGTIAWAGGLVDWDSPSMQNGYYFAMFSDVSVQCYDPPSGYDNEGDKAYAYTSVSGVQGAVAITNNNTILDSLEATGDNPHVGEVTGSAAANYSVPGVSGAGTASSGQSPVDEGGASSGSPSGSGTSGSSTYSGSGFSQGSSSSDGARLVAGSLVALTAVFAAAMML